MSSSNIASESFTASPFGRERPRERVKVEHVLARSLSPDDSVETLFRNVVRRAPSGDRAPGPEASVIQGALAR
jgi:hypothetical protein